MHDSDECILTKVLFIGRIYAAAVERRKSKSSMINDKFYTEIIAPAFKKSELDTKLSKLKFLTLDKEENIISALQTHHYLTAILKVITALEKRSFSSKYLHFHIPEMFYIYDSRAVTAMREFKIKLPTELEELINVKDIDKEYAAFFFKCVTLKNMVKDTYQINLSNRQLDNLLLEVANTRASAK